MVRCPECGLPLQSLDLPCPVCLAAEEAPDAFLAHTYSKTLHNRQALRGRYGGLIQDVNAWLAEQPGLIDAWLTFHRGFGGEVTAITVTCAASGQPTTQALSLHRLPLTQGAVARRSRDLGTALNEWGHEHPDLAPVRQTVLQTAGVDLDCWVTASGPYVPALAPSARDHRPLWLRAVESTLRAVPYLLFCAALMSIVAVLGAIGGGDLWKVPTIIASLLLGATYGSAILVRRIGARNARGWLSTRGGG